MALGKPLGRGENSANEHSRIAPLKCPPLVFSLAPIEGPQCAKRKAYFGETNLWRAWEATGLGWVSPSVHGGGGGRTHHRCRIVPNGRFPFQTQTINPTISILHTPILSHHRQNFVTYHRIDIIFPFSKNQPQNPHFTQYLKGDYEFQKSRIFHPREKIIFRMVCRPRFSASANASDSPSTT